MRTGDLAPDFTLADQDGKWRELSASLTDGPVVLFFFPAAMTAGCTKESCHFRDLQADFGALGAQRIGISMDTVARLAQFATQNRFDYPMLSDPDGHVAQLFAVKRTFDFLKVKRTTFVIDQDRSIVEIVNSELNMNAHADRALAALRSLRR